MEKEQQICIYISEKDAGTRTVGWRATGPDGNEYGDYIEVAASADLIAVVRDIAEMAMLCLAAVTSEIPTVK